MPSRGSKIITRFPPSPSGLFHIGSARTALFNYLFAKNQGGEMILRFEDTDTERSKKEYEEDILAGLKWLGIEHEGKIQKQSERTEIYKKYLNNLIETDKAYISKEDPSAEASTELSRTSSGQGRERREEVIRFRNPGGEVSFDDLVRGTVRFDVGELEDFVIAKSLDEPLYHLAVVVDDHEMEITHVIRGDDHISNTPRQVLILEALGFERPIYAHIPLILAPDKSKLSKRHGTVSVNEYKEKGYLPEALVNYLALLGWNPGDEREIFSMEELIKEFSLEKVHKGGAIFGIEKLNWFDLEHTKLSSLESLKNLIKIYLGSSSLEEKEINSMAAILKDRGMHNVGELKEEFSFEEDYDSKKLIWKEDTGTKNHLEEAVKLLEGLDNFNPESVKETLWPLAEKKGKGEVLWPIRYALSGKDKSPDPFTLASFRGKEETLKRLNEAINKLT